MRAILLERGMVAPQGNRKLHRFLTVLMDEQDGADLSPRMILLVADGRVQWPELARQIGPLTPSSSTVKENEEARRLTTIPGIGAIVASALSPPSVDRKASSAGAISQPCSEPTISACRSRS
jgi:transposase